MINSQAYVWEVSITVVSFCFFIHKDIFCSFLKVLIRLDQTK